MNKHCVNSDFLTGQDENKSCFSSKNVKYFLLFSFPCVRICCFFIYDSKWRVSGLTELEAMWRRHFGPLESVMSIFHNSFFDIL